MRLSGRDHFLTPGNGHAAAGQKILLHIGDDQRIAFFYHQRLAHELLFNFATSEAKALPRWLIRFFTSMGISAPVWPNSGIRKYGS